MRRFVFGTSLLLLLIVTTPTLAVIIRLTPLSQVVEEAEVILVARVDKLDPDRPAMILALDETLKGTALSKSMPVLLKGNAGAIKRKEPPQLLKRLARLDVLLIDELGYLNLKPEQSNIFFKLMEERYRQHSTIITTNLVYDEWPNFLGNRLMVDALLSRLRHYCHTVHIEGPSLRELQG